MTDGPGIDFDLGRLVSYLGEVLPDLTGGLRFVEKIGGGQSNPTFRLSFADRNVVLRKQPAGELLPSAHAVDREYRVQKALAATDVPVPEMVHLCEDREVIGTLFYVMEALDGRVFHDSLLPGMPPEERSAIYASMNQTLAKLHKVDWQAVGLEGFGKPGNYFERQIARWMRQWEASKTKEIAAIDRLIAWLPAHVDRGRRDDDRPRRFPSRQSDVSPFGKPRGDRYSRLGAVDARPSAGRSRLQRHALACDAGRCMSASPAIDRGGPGHSHARRLCPPAIAEGWGGSDGITTFHLAFSMFRFAVIFEGIAQACSSLRQRRQPTMPRRSAVLSEAYARLAWSLVESDFRP